MTYRNMRVWVGVGLVAFALTVHGQPRAAERRPADVGVPDEKALAAQLEKPLPEINFQGQGFADVIDFLRDVSAANIFVDWRALEKAGIDKNAPVTARLRNVKLKTALDKVLESVAPKNKLGWKADQGVITIGPGGAERKPNVVGQIPQEHDRVLPEVSFSGVALADVIDFMRDVTGKNIFVNWRELEAAGIKKDSPVEARLRNTTLSTTLKAVLESVSDGKSVVEFGFEDDVISIKAGPKQDEKPKEKGGK
jgi:hypothetical protein